MSFAGRLAAFVVDRSFLIMIGTGSLLAVSVRDLQLPDRFPFSEWLNLILGANLVSSGWLMLRDIQMRIADTSDAARDPEPRRGCRRTRRDPGALTLSRFS